MNKRQRKKIANATLSVMAMTATIFANMACRGRCYEPVVPKALLETECKK